MGGCVVWHSSGRCTYAYNRYDCTVFFAGVRVVVDRTLGTFYDNLFRKCYQLYRTIVERLR